MLEELAFCTFASKSCPYAYREHLDFINIEDLKNCVCSKECTANEIPSKNHFCLNLYKTYSYVQYIILPKKTITH